MSGRLSRRSCETPTFYCFVSAKATASRRAPVWRPGRIQMPKMTSHLTSLFRTERYPSLSIAYSGACANGQTPFVFILTIAGIRSPRDIGSELMASPEIPIPARTLPHWQVEYESALRETDYKMLFKRVEIAEAALLNRRESLDRPSDCFQRTEVEIALSKLRLLKREILNF
jgi:hypothetical protein